MSPVIVILFYYFIYLCGWGGVELSQLLLRPFIDLLRQLSKIDGDDCGSIAGMNEWQGKLKY
jgi:hypothetical protein